MNFAHLHLMMNHFPIIGTMVGLGLFLVSLVGKNEDMRRSSYVVFAGIALLSIPAFLSGYGASLAIKDAHGISDALIQRHYGSAMLSLWFVLATGVFSLIALWQYQRPSGPSTWNVAAVLVLSLLSVGLMARTGTTGGDISHAEVRPSDMLSPSGMVVEGPIGSILAAIEPTPDKFSQAMVFSKWWWTFMMVMHFLGLCMIVGTVGLLDIRIMGFLKALPVGPLHRFIPWALAGLGINILTGLLAFIGQPDNYIYSGVFWLKILSLLLLGVNAVAFYMTDIFAGVEDLKAGEDATFSAKLVAASSLFLWFAVITLGRFIQPVADTFRPAGN
jgi:uncharacterized membrane protein